MCKTLENLIRRSQDKEHLAQNELIDKFSPLLKKYAAKLKYDDAYNDLLIDMLELIQKLNTESISDKSDGVFVSYIHKSIIHAYSRRQAKTDLYKETPFSNLSEEDSYRVENTASNISEALSYDSEFYSSALNTTERDVLLLIYQYGYKASEIAKKRGITRQAVNQAKIRALKKLREHCD